MRIPIEKPNSIGNVLAYVFVLCILAAFVLHFLSYGEARAGAHDRKAELQRALLEQQTIFHHYAPIAQQGKIAERQLTLANQKANLIREELALLEGKE